MSNEKVVFTPEVIDAAIAAAKQGGVPDVLAEQNVKSSAGLLRPGKVDLWVAERYSPAPKASVPDDVRKPDLNDGETYIGLIGDAAGEAYHLVLLPGDSDAATWQDQMDWAKRIGGDLPNRIEQAMLWAHHRDQFKKDWYWSNETHHGESSWAWCQDFNYGYQGDYRKSYELRARAVRRVSALAAAKKGGV